jgi:tetratricopeptide (TPR) repeat protein
MSRFHSPPDLKDAARTSHHVSRILKRTAKLRGVAALLAVALYAQQQPEMLLRQAVEAHQRGDIDSAIRQYREFLKLRPSSVEGRSNLGAALARKGEYAAAVKEYEAALRLAPGNPGVLLNLALAHYKTGDLHRAAEELTALRGNPQATLLLADCWLQLGENKKVIALLKPLNAAEAAEPAIIYMLGTALIRDQQFSAGQVLLDKILKNGDSAEARLLMGTAKLGVADFAAAVQDLARAVELNPKLPSVNSYYGQALMATGDTAAAAKAFRAELEQFPNDFDANLNLAVILRQDQQNDEAMKLLARALRVRPKDVSVRYQIASLELARGKVESAQEKLAQIVQEAPKFTEAHVSLATAYYRLKRKEEGDRERAIVQRLNEEAQAAQPKGELLGSEAVKRTP